MTEVVRIGGKKARSRASSCPRSMAALWASLTLLASVTPAVAQGEVDPVAEARALHQRGHELFQAGDYAGAAAEFELAHRLYPNPMNLYNLARCYEPLGRIGDAIDVLERFLDSDAPADLVAEARAMLERCRAVPGEIEVSTEPPGARVLIDGAPTEDITPATVRVPPGEHVVEIGLEGQGIARQELRVDPGSRLRVHVEIELAPPAPTPPSGSEAEPSQGVRWTFSVEVAAGTSVPLSREDMGATFVVGGDLSVGIEAGRRAELRSVVHRTTRIELVAAVAGHPFDSGSLVEAGLGLRAGFLLGRTPLRLEVELLLGLGVLSVSEDGLEIPRGGAIGFALFPACSLVWRAARWLEVVLRPARVEVLGLSRELPASLGSRWSMDLALRFRL